MIEKPANRNKQGKFIPGFSGNPSGRPANTMKDFLKRKFSEMTDENKELFLLSMKVTGKDMIEFGEGKAKQDAELDITVTSKVIKLDE